MIDLTLLSTERETVSSLDFDYIIEQFVTQKARKIALL